jgi:anti-sigma B factor antagonist
MTITENKTSNSLELVIGGRLDTSSAPELEAKLKQIDKDVQTLYLNLANIQYISSAGLRVVLLAHKLMLPTGGKMIIRQPSAFCKQVLSATGMDSILTVEG